MRAALICREYRPSPICPWPCRWHRPDRSMQTRTMAAHMRRMMRMMRMTMMRMHGDDGTSAVQCATAMRRARVERSKARRNRAQVRASAERRAAERSPMMHSVTCRKTLTRRTRRMMTTKKRTRRTRRVAQRQLAPARLRIWSCRHRVRAVAAGSGAKTNRQTEDSCVRNLQWRKKS